MPLSDPATAAQVKVLAQQAADIALASRSEEIANLTRAVQQMAGASNSEGVSGISPLMKAIGGIGSALVVSALLWVASSVTAMQETLARIDERQKAATEAQDSRFADYDRRISRLERHHSLEGSGS